MNTEQEQADFEAWAASIGFCVTGKYAETIDVLCAKSAFKAGYQAGRAALHSHDREDVATEATGGHRLVEPDHETELALADAPRSLRNYVAALRSAIALQSQTSHAGWKEAAIAWEVCASLHREFCKGRDPLFKVRQADFVKHAEDARTRALETEVLQSQDRADAERYRWLRDEAGLMVLPYDDHGLGPEFPCGSELDAAIDHARRVEEEGK